MTKRNLMLLALGFLAIGWKLQDVGASEGCAEYEVLDNPELSCEIQKEIVDSHNKYRQKLAKGLVKGQPAAANMREMYWDDELARNAQKWADHCTFEHDSGKTRNVERFKVGQNLGLGQSMGKSETSPQFPEFIKNWFDEHEMYKYSPIGNIGSTGHYTQVAWANSYLVGCGYKSYKESSIVHQLYVCNYGPAGNYVGEHPYEVGSHKCDSELIKSKSYSGLCAMKKQPVSACSGSSRRRLHSKRKNKKDESEEESTENCTGNNCLTSTVTNKTEKAKVNLYNFIVINV